MREKWKAGGHVVSLTSERISKALSHFLSAIIDSPSSKWQDAEA